ncbi:MAG: hypothetical protein FJ247_08290 [Nitrospira sp.]|nr:hypothetical protein [Nitrospira sp.]
MRGRLPLIGVMIVIVGLGAGCTQAGPFVTNMSSSGPNKFLIEKCHVQLNAFMWTVSNDHCTTHELTFQVQSNGTK